ncbi:MAG: hypothetical protein Q8M66_01455, partial [Actinomycetota bacterium]|nr:hypothetical protein [Actinomycetota bacterium]
ASAVFEGLRPGGTYSLMNVLFPFSIVAAGELTHYFIEFVAPVAALVGIKVLADDDSLGLGLRAGLCYLALSTASQLVAPFASYGLKWHLPLWEQARALAFHLGAPLGFDALYWLLAANLASTALLLAARRLAGRAGRAKSEAEGEAAACLTSASSRTPSGTLVPERSASAEAPRR